MRSITLTLCLWTFLAGCGHDAEETQKDSEKQLESIALSYIANKETFRHGRFRFDYTRGTSAGAEDCAGWQAD